MREHVNKKNYVYMLENGVKPLTEKMRAKIRESEQKSIRTPPEKRLNMQEGRAATGGNGEEGSERTVHPKRAAPNMDAPPFYKTESADMASPFPGTEGRAATAGNGEEVCRYPFDCDLPGRLAEVETAVSAVTSELTLIHAKLDTLCALLGARLQASLEPKEKVG